MSNIFMKIIENISKLFVSDKNIDKKIDKKIDKFAKNRPLIYDDSGYPPEFRKIIEDERKKELK